MAMEHYIQEPLSQNSFHKQDGASVDKWKSLSESVDESESGLSGGFDCNICLEPVQDPVVTLCGHLYCWPCIYKWIYHQSTSPEFPDKLHPECPVCKSEVSEKMLVPLYGRGQTTKPSSEEKALDLGMPIPRRPPSPRCGINTNPRGYQQYAPPALAMPSLGSIPMTDMVSPISSISPTTGMFGEMVYARIFGNSQTTLYAYPNSYNLAGLTTQRARRQAVQADRSLSRVCFFLLCCISLCLLLF